MSAVDSPHPGESAALRARLRGMVMGSFSGGLVMLDLASGQRHEIRMPPGTACLSEPDNRGRVVRAHGRPGRPLQVEHIHREGLLRILWSQPPEATDSVRHISLSPDGSRAAWLEPAGSSDSTGTEPTVGANATRASTSPTSSTSSSSWTLGRLMTLDVEGAYGSSPLPPRDRGVPVLGHPLVRNVLSWFPDGRHLAAVVQGPLGRKEGPPSMGRAQPDPQVVVVDMQSLTPPRTLSAGRQVWVSTTGRTVLVRIHARASNDREAIAQDAWAGVPSDLRLLDAATGQPLRLTHAPPEITAVVGWLDDRHLVYRGAVTPGAPTGLTIGNSPLVGPKLLQAVKVMDTHTGEFVSVLQGVDPRSHLSVR